MNIPKSMTRIIGDTRYDGSTWIVSLSPLWKSGLWPRVALTRQPGGRPKTRANRFRLRWSVEEGRFQKNKEGARLDKNHPVLADRAGRVLAETLSPGSGNRRRKGDPRPRTTRRVPAGGALNPAPPRKGKTR